MKRFHAFIFLASIFISISAQVRWLGTEHDFGLIDEADGDVDCVFSMINDGDGDVAVISVKAACGCTKVDYPIEAIAPGDTAHVRVFFSPDKFAGQFKKNISVRTSDKSTKDILYISGTVKAGNTTLNLRFPGNHGDIRLQQSWIHIGDVESNKLKCRAFPAYNNSGDTLNIEVLKTPEYLQVSPVPTIVPPAETFSFVCYVDPTKTAESGAVGDSITISINPDKTLKIPFSTYFNEKY